jgi:arginyl-tRNA synthetase
MYSTANNPLGEFRRECQSILKDALAKALPKVYFPTIPFTTPPSPSLGDLSTSILFEAAKAVGENPLELAQQVANSTVIEADSLVREVGVGGGGYINFYANYPVFSALTLESARAMDEAYGSVPIDKPKRIIVEHTSINPAGPIHVGTARNSVLGDSLARLLKARGHNVKTHFYIDDVGRQIAVLAYGYDILGRPEPKGKADHWIGLVYAITNCVFEVQALNRQIKKLEWSTKSSDELAGTRRKLDEWVGVAAELREKDEELFDELAEKIRGDQDAEARVAEIMRKYEARDPTTVALVRGVVELCLRGFKETYSRAGIEWDSWDWESDLVWDGSVSEVVSRLKKTAYAAYKMGALVLDVNSAAEDLGLKKMLGISEAFELPPLVLVRNDGTTLYTTRDIAYSLWKLSRADTVVNVIGVEQTLPQLQLKVALSLLLPQRAKDLIHYAYELVSLPGYKMSKRRGRFIAFDGILDEAESRARREVESRSPEMPEEAKKEISKAVATGAVKFALLDVAANKQVVFTWDRVLNFDTNSAPFIQYAHARACNILQKAEGGVGEIDYSLLSESAERELVWKIASFPEEVSAAADSLSPSAITAFANSLAAKFNSFYASLPVLKARPEGLRGARLALADCVRIVLRNSLQLLGIKALTRM